jgi:molybdopterin molybdotransferase
MISLASALQQIAAARADWGVETVPLDRALGRVLSEDVHADRDYPPFNRATMDGYAVKSETILGNPGAALRVVGELRAGDTAGFVLQAGDALKIMTGAPVPDSADAVIKKEEADEHDGVVTFRVENFKRFQNIASQGEDADRGSVILARRRQLEFGHLSLLAAVGMQRVEVARLPRIAVIATGNEIQPVSGTVAPHQIRDSNTWAVSGYLRRYGIETAATAIVRDTIADLSRAFDSVLDHDVLIVSGGVSAGDADLVPAALAKCGVQEHFHRVKIKPGKPLWFGSQQDGVRVFALPGNPFSVQTACRIFIDEFLRSSFRLPAAGPLMLPLTTGRKKRTSFDEFFPAALSSGRMSHIDPLLYTTSGDITAAAGSDGIALHPAEAGDLAQGESAAMYRWNG